MLKGAFILPRLQNFARRVWEAYSGVRCGLFIESSFKAYISNAADVLGFSKEALMHGLRQQYNGFCFDRQASTHVYCPWSVLNFFSHPKQGFLNYWYESGGKPAVLMKYLSNHELEDPASYASPKEVSLSDLSISQHYSDMQLEALLFQAGYLTIQSLVDRETLRLGYPNAEVSQSMADLYAAALLGGRQRKRSSSPSLTDLLKGGRLDEVVGRFNEVFHAIDYQRYPVKDEASCRGYLQVLMIGADMVPSVEVHSALGKSDLEVDAGSLRWIFEVKFAPKDAQAQACLDQGIAQIKRARYGEAIKGLERRTLMRAVIVFSAESRSFVLWSLVSAPARGCADA